MAFVTAAIIGGGSAILGGYIASRGAKSAANTQANAQLQAAGTQQAMFDRIAGQNQPFMQAGYGANRKLSDLMGVQSADTFDSNAYLKANPDVAADPYYSQHPFEHFQKAGQGEGRQYTSNDPAGFGSLTKNFTPQDFKNNLDPGYGFRRDQGAQALTSQMTPGASSLSSSTIRSLMDFNQGLASQEYGNAFNRFQTQNGNVFSRLKELAGIGQASANNTAAAGSTLGTGVAQAQAGAGASQAAGTVGAANAMSGAISGAGMMPFYSSYLGKQVGSTSTGNTPAAPMASIGAGSAPEGGDPYAAFRIGGST